MSRYELDPRTGMMVPKKDDTLRLTMRMGGTCVEYDKFGISFIIMKKNDKIEYARGLDRRGVKRFDYTKSMMIANYLKRVQPHSKYTDYRWFCVSCPNPKDVDESLESSDMDKLTALVEQYGIENVKQMFHINEDDWFDLERAHSTQGETVGTKMHGVGGFIKALPSAIISAVICWPVALLNLIGALHIRAEERWKKSLLNPNVWKDYIMTPYTKDGKSKSRKLSQKEFDRLSKHDKDSYLQEQFIINNRFYYAMLSNHEVYRVVGARAEDARDMAREMVKALKPTYAKLNQKISMGGNAVHTYVVHLDDGEIALWAATDKQTAMKEVRTSRKEVNAFYKKQGWIRNQDKDQVEATYLPDIVEVEDLGPNRPIDPPIPDDSHIEISESPKDYFSNRTVDKYLIDDIEWIKLQIEAKTTDDLEKILNKVFRNETFLGIYRYNKENKELSRGRSTNSIECFEIAMRSGCVYKLYINESKLPEEIEKEAARYKKSHKGSLGDYDVYEKSAVFLARKLEEVIQKEVKDFYKGSSKTARGLSAAYSGIEHQENITAMRQRQPAKIEIPKEVDASLINPDTEEAISGKPTRISLPRAA